MEIKFEERKATPLNPVTRLQKRIATAIAKEIADNLMDGKTLAAIKVIRDNVSRDEYSLTDCKVFVSQFYDRDNIMDILYLNAKNRKSLIKKIQKKYIKKFVLIYE